MAKKDAYYFPHYCNARSDNKIMKLRRILGLEGYAIYFMLLEILREQTDFKYPLDSISELEFEFRTSKEKIATVIMDYELFEVDKKNNFFSSNLIKFLLPYLEKSERASDAANKKWEIYRLKNANADANADSFADANACAKRVKESKVNKGDKVKESIIGDKSPAQKSFKNFSEKDFIEDLSKYKSSFDKDLLNNFFKYWKELSPGGKMKFQLEKTWETNLRLEKWKNNQYNGTIKKLNNEASHGVRNDGKYQLGELLKKSIVPE